VSGGDASEHLQEPLSQVVNRARVQVVTTGSVEEDAQIVGEIAFGTPVAEKHPHPWKGLEERDIVARTGGVIERFQSPRAPEELEDVEEELRILTGELTQASLAAVAEESGPRPAFVELREGDPIISRKRPPRSI